MKESTAPMCDGFGIFTIYIPTDFRDKYSLARIVIRDHDHKRK
jgi:hypothetical protein